MDLTTTIVITVIMALFFGGILWMAIHSRQSGSEQPPAPSAERKILNENESA